MFFFCISCNVYGQRDSIKYVFPDSIEIITNSHLKSQNKSKPNQSFYFHLQKSNKDTFNLSIFEHTNLINRKLEKWILSTSRFVLIDDKYYPLLLEEDFIFGTVTERDFGIIGRRYKDLKIKRIFLTGEPFGIEFTKKGHVVRSGYF